MGGWRVAVLLLAMACGEAPLEAVSGGTSSEGPSTGTSASPTGGGPGPGSTAASLDGSGGGTTQAMPPEVTSSTGAAVASSDGPASTSEGSGGSSSSTGVVRVTCEELILPESPPAMCSVTSGMGRADLVIVNDCESITLDTKWVNYVGDGCFEEFTVAITPPGQSDTVQTYVTHPFRVRNMATGDLMLEIPPVGAGTTMVTVP